MLIHITCTNVINSRVTLSVCLSYDHTVVSILMKLGIKILYFLRKDRLLCIMINQYTRRSSRGQKQSDITECKCKTLNEYSKIN